MIYIILISITILLLYQKVKGSTMIVSQTMEKWSTLAILFGSQFNVSPSLILAVIQQESGGNQEARGNKNDVGLMQVTPIAIADVNRFYNVKFTTEYITLWPDANIKCGTAFLSMMLKQSTSEYEALRFYNAGKKGATDNQYLGSQYATSVLEYKKQFEKEFSGNVII